MIRIDHQAIMEKGMELVNYLLVAHIFVANVYFICQDLKGRGWMASTEIGTHIQVQNWFHEAMKRIV